MRYYVELESHLVYGGNFDGPEDDAIQSALDWAAEEYPGTYGTWSVELVGEIFDE